MDKILRGIVRYNVAEKAKFVTEMDRFNKGVVKPVSVFISCMDTRVLPSRFVQSDIGEVFFMRNAGNMVPHYDAYKEGRISTEGGGMELGCITNKIRNVVVCGHSDCKAVIALYGVRHDCDHTHHHLTSPLRTWVTLHGQRTIEKFSRIFLDEKMEPIERRAVDRIPFPINLGCGEIGAIIDPDDEWCIEDELSMAHCLEQASHVATYPMLRPLIESGELHVHAMWFDVHTGSVYLFNPVKKRFVLVNESSVNILKKDLDIK